MQTLSQRWSMLEPAVTVVGPDDDRPRPAVILFHGCGGLRGHLPKYAAAAKAAGWRAFIVDSYGPRGWSRAFAMAMVCTGVLLHGSQRAGDILAALLGVSQRRDVDGSKIVLAGWSHGGSDAGSVPLDGVIGTWLAYPYVGIGAFNKMRPWKHCPKTVAVISRTDHLTTVRNAQQVHDMVRNCGADVETWIADGTHSFDEPMTAPPMRYHPELAAEAERRFVALLNDVAVAPGV
ncbi:MAG: dienelactone hydrolase-like protein [bacterium]|nr:MAG: dienelactone hydrolase-like protein [bacterium]